MKLPQSTVAYPGYRQFRSAQASANDAMMALLISSRLARHHLQLHKGSPVTLPVLFPNVPEISRINRTVEDAQELITGAERHLAYMAIPYALSVYGEVVIDALRIIALDGIYKGPSSRLTGGQIHSEFEAASGVALPKIEADLYEFINAARNRMIHSAAFGSPHIVSLYANLGPGAIALWSSLAGRHLLPAGPRSQLPYAAPELIATLSLTRRLALSINRILQTSVSLDTWALVAVRDYRRQNPRKWGDIRLRERSLQGFFRSQYPALGLTSAHAEEASRRVEQE